VGQIVYSIKGKDAGVWYIVAGYLSEEGRLVLLGVHRGNLIFKKKNPKHIQWTRSVVSEVARRLKEGGVVDPGWLTERASAAGYEIEGGSRRMKQPYDQR
jgi:hypothetical protein